MWLLNLVITRGTPPRLEGCRPASRGLMLALMTFEQGIARGRMGASPVSSLTEIGAFKRGLFHVQDPASTLVTRYAAVPEGSTVADLCAAPGGKCVELARAAGAVFSSDVSLHRLGRLRENLARLDLPKA